MPMASASEACQSRNPRDTHPHTHTPPCPALGGEVFGQRAGLVMRGSLPEGSLNTYYGQWKRAFPKE